MNKFRLTLLILLCLAGVEFAVFSLFRPQSKKTAPPPSQKQRLVSLAPNLTEILFALGLGEKIIAVSSDSDYPPQATGKIKVGTFWQPSTESIVACKPDLIIAESIEQHKTAAESLSRLGYQVLSLRLRKIDELFSAIKKIGEQTACLRQADEFLRNISQQLDNLQSKLASTKKVKVLWVVQPEPLRVAGRDTFINEMLELAGGENAIGPTVQQYPSISGEEILACGAEVIILSAMDKDNIAQEQQAALAYWSKWPTLPAVKNNRIYLLDADTTLRLGPRLPTGVEAIARCLHPEVFAQEYKTEQKNKVN